MTGCVYGGTGDVPVGLWGGSVGGVETAVVWGAWRRELWRMLVGGWVCICRAVGGCVEEGVGGMEEGVRVCGGCLWVGICRTVGV